MDVQTANEMCLNNIEDEVKRITFSEEISEEEKLEEIYKLLVANEIDNFGVTLEELGLTIEDIYNKEYWHSISDEFSKVETEQFSTKIIPLYGYVSKEYGPTGIGPNTRVFCSKLVNRTKLALMRKQDIEAMNSMNPGLGKGGSNSYSIFNWRGGANCRHTFVKYLYNPDTRNLVKSPDQPTQTTVNGKVPFANGTNKPTKK